MPNPDRTATNRANAAKSTGPRTPEGKARSSQNARKHTFNPEHFAVIRLEEVHVIADLRADAIACYRPVNSQELFAVERIALSQQSLLRCAALENGLFTCCLNEIMNGEDLPVSQLLSEVLTHDLEVTRAQNRNFCLAKGFTHNTRKYSPTWPIFLRYQAQTERLYRRAIEDFDRLKALRPELPNDPKTKPAASPSPLRNRKKPKHRPLQGRKNRKRQPHPVPRLPPPLPPRTPSRPPAPERNPPLRSAKLHKNYPTKPQIHPSPRPARPRNRCDSNPLHHRSVSDLAATAADAEAQS